MIGETLITKQTGEEGKPCSKVILAERVYARRELYFSILMDRAHGGPVMVASARGGTSIEDIAAATPEAIITMPVNIINGPSAQDLDGLVSKLGFSSGETKASAAHIFGQVALRCCVHWDCATAHLTALALTSHCHRTDVLPTSPTSGLTSPASAHHHPPIHSPIVHIHQPLHPSHTHFGHWTRVGDGGWVGH